MCIKELKRIANAFRKAFETVGRAQSFGSFPNFPEGCCTWASIFIGNFFINEYGLSPKRVYSATHSNGSQHEWVLLDGIIIDITADQFDNAPESVIVGAESQWHMKFEGSEINDYSPVSKYDIIGQQKISDIYKKIVSEVNVLIKQTI